MSMSVYCPRHDYLTAVHVIAWYRVCSVDADLVRDLVSFHLFFDGDHLPPGQVWGQEKIKDFEEGLRVSGVGL